MAVTDTLTLSFLVTAGEVGNTLTLDFEVLSAQTRQPGGWLPNTIYTDEKGRVVDLKAVKAVVREEIEQEPPKKRKAAVRVSERVFEALGKGQDPRKADLERLRNMLSESREALAALNAVIWQREQDDEEAAILLLAA